MCIRDRRYTGGLSSKAAVPYPKLSTQMAKGATTVKEAVSRAEIAVDKVAGEITAVVQAVEDTQNYVNGAIEQVTQSNSAAIEISQSNILNTVSQLYTTQTETCLLYTSKLAHHIRAGAAAVFAAGASG